MDIDTVNISVKDDVAKTLESSEVEYTLKTDCQDKTVSIDNKEQVAAQ